nr:TRAP transporter small permease [Palleronia pontilimi]
MAWLGGAMLLILIVMTCVSILGRSLNGMLHGDAVTSIAPGLARWLLDLGIGPIQGDFELVEAGVAVAIFSFLPYCTLTGGHASVDIFTAKLPPRANRILQMCIDTLFAAVLVLIAVQLGAGTLSKMNSGQLSFLLQFPIWWGYAACLPGAWLAAVVGIYLAAMRMAETAAGRAILPPLRGSER